MSFGERGQQRAGVERVESIPRRLLVLFKQRIPESLGGRSLVLLLFFLFGSSCVSQVVPLGCGQTMFRGEGSTLNQRILRVGRTRLHPEWF